MSLGISLHGRYGSNRSELPPSISQELLQKILGWLQQELGSELLDARIRPGFAQKPTLFAKLHPAASPIEVLGIGRGRLTVQATTANVGPGYHQYLCTLLERLAETFAITWDPIEQGHSSDDTGYWQHRRRPLLERVMLSFLQQMAKQLLTALSRGASKLLVGLPQTHLYTFSEEIGTILGPRDRAWVEATAADPTQGIDFFPWWNEGKGVDYLIGNALCRMYTDIRWRPALLPDEAMQQQTVVQLLSQVYKHDETLPMPWREWAELLGYLGRPATFVLENAAQSEEMPPIGYRREPVKTLVHGAWHVTIPGSFAERHDEKGTFYAFDETRALLLRSMFAENAETAPKPEVLLESLSLPEGELFSLQEEARHGKASFFAREEAGKTQYILQAYVAEQGRLAEVSLRFSEKESLAWALACWRSISSAR